MLSVDHVKHCTHCINSISDDSVLEGAGQTPCPWQLVSAEVDMSDVSQWCELLQTKCSEEGHLPVPRAAAWRVGRAGQRQSEGPGKEANENLQQ